MLTRRHNIVTRYAVAFLGAIATLILTTSIVLSYEIFRTFKRDQFVAGVRRLSWYMRRSWLGLDVSQDPVPVFFQGLSLAELSAQRRFVLRNAKKCEPDVLAGELCCISGCAALVSFGTDMYDQHLRQFHADAEIALETSLQAPPLTTHSDVADSHARNSFSRGNAEQALRDTIAFLEGHGVEVFILSGTFLGAVRENAILEHDYDIDLGVMACEITPYALEKLLSNSTFTHSITTNDQIRIERNDTGSLSSNSIPVLYKFHHVNGTAVDIFLHYKEQDIVWHGSSMHRWDNTEFTLMEYSLAGIKVKGPANADRYLTENYGDWRTPKRAFYCGADTPNLRLLPNPRSMALALRQLRFSAGSDLIKARTDHLERMEQAGYIEKTKVGTWRVTPDVFSR